MKYSSYLAFDNKEAQGLFKKVFHDLLDNDNSIHYSDNIHREGESNRVGFEVEGGVGIGMTLGGIAGFVGGPPGSAIGMFVGGAIGGGIGNMKSWIKYDTKRGHFKEWKEDFCGWCWECTCELLAKKKIFKIEEWICPQNCNLILLLEPIESFDNEEKRKQKQKTYSLRKNSVYSFDFSNRDLIKIKNNRKKTKDLEKVLTSIYSKFGTIDLREENEESRLINKMLKDKIDISEAVEIVRFKTWWNNNLFAIISGDDLYTIWLLIYEPERNKMKEMIRKITVTHGYNRNNLKDSKKKIDELIDELNKNNPILAVVENNETISKKDIITEPHIIEISIFPRRETVHFTDTQIVFASEAARCYKPFVEETNYIGGGMFEEKYSSFKIVEEYPKNPDDYLKPLDIIRIKNPEEEFAIYLGKKQFCCLKSDKKGARLETWNNLLENAKGEIVRYHPIIPFMRWEKIINNIVKTIAINYKKDGKLYDNGKSYVWEQITGIDCSRIFSHKSVFSSFFKTASIRKKEKSDLLINPKEEISKSQKKIEQLELEDIFQIEKMIKEIKGSENRWEAQIKVPACKLM